MFCVTCADYFIDLVLSGGERSDFDKYQEIGARFWSCLTRHKRPTNAHNLTRVPNTLLHEFIVTGTLFIAFILQVRRGTTRAVYIR